MSVKLSKNPYIQYDGEPYDDDECDLYGCETCYDYFIEDLQSLMDERLKTSFLKVRAEDIGWNHRGGYKYVNTDNARVLLGEILPNTECNLYVYKIPKGICIVAKHHDNPVNGDHYYVTSVAESTYHTYS